MIAINPRHQSTLNKAVQWLYKHNAFNDQRDAIENELEHSYMGEQNTAWRRINKKCEDSFEKYQEYCCDLPVRQVKLIEKSELY